MKSTVRVTKWVAGGLEALLGIPVLGASIIIGLVWTPLAIMLVFHIVNLVLSKNEDLPVAGSILGIVGNAIGWIVLNNEYTYSSEMLEKQLKIFFEGKGVNLENILNFFKEVSIKKYIIGPELFLEMQQASSDTKNKISIKNSFEES